MAGLLKFLTCGSVDDGKSTLIGHLLYDSKLIYTDQEKALKLESKVGSRNGKLDYALLLDGLLAEHEQGITIDVAYRYFTTKRRSFIVADTPGHEEYTRNMAVGASFADLAVILLDASKGVLPQTRRHARICKLLGIKHYIFAINKMDMVQYREDRFKTIEVQLSQLIAQLHLQHMYMIPLSATEGDNITTKSSHTPWYKGETLLYVLETVDIDNEDNHQGFYLPVQRVSRPNHTFRGFQGKAETGSIHIGDTLTVLPSGEQSAVKAIYNAGLKVKDTYKGQALTLQLDREIDVSRGCVFVKNVKPAITKSITGEILWMDDEPLHLNQEYSFRLATASTTAIVKAVNYKIDVNTGAHVHAETLYKNELASCSISLNSKLPIALFDEYAVLGGFILINYQSNVTAACGVVRRIDNTETDVYSFVDGDIKVDAPIFTDFVFDLTDNTIKQVRAEYPIFHVGDTIPLTGKTYMYPPDFDILSLQSQTIVLIRGSRVEKIEKWDTYRYEAAKEIPLVDSHGFAIENISIEKDKHLGNSKIDLNFHKWHTIGFIK